MLLVLGTHNQKKVNELRPLLQPYPVELQSLADLPSAIEVVEDGETFGDNARLKAVQQATHLKEWVMAEDSGLVVPALRGRPGVYSARFAGEQATDESNNAKLLDEMRSLKGPQRDAFYVCHITLSDPQGAVHLEAEDTCRGRILEQARGDGGFGYDPLFEIPEYHQTFAQLGSVVKSVLSHRARATRKFLKQFEKLLQSESVIK